VDLRAADLRRTGAALLADLGVAPEVVAGILGRQEPGAGGAQAEARADLLPRMRDALEALAARLAVLAAQAQ
jgi:hypothetical protein